MKIHVSPRHLELTPAIESQTVSKLGALEHLNSYIVSAHVVLSHDQTADPDARFTASARIAVAGPDLHAEEHAADLYVAIDAVAAKLARQLRKRKTRLTDKRRGTVQRQMEKDRTGAA